MELASALLDTSHVVSSFISGNDHLDRWLRNSAARGNKQNTGRTWVIHEGDKVVLGYYTLAAHVLHRESLSTRTGRGLPTEIPSILLAKLALDLSLQGQGFGRNLLLEALSKCVSSGLIVASRFVVVDAIDERAATFCERYGFLRISGTDPARLHRKLSDIAADLDDD